jgi:hypothetical protein
MVVGRLKRNVGGCWTAFAGIVLLTGCKADPVWTTSNLVPTVRLISDNPSVRLLISTQEKGDDAELRWLRDSRTHEGLADRRRHPEQYAPTLRSFIEAMKASPGFAVRGGSLCRLVERSQARCTPDPLDTYAYVKVRIIEGPNRGMEGWACEVRDVVSTTPKFL